MTKLSILTTLIFICLYSYGQEYVKYESRIKHSDKIISIAASNESFATSSEDESFIVWDYKGKLIYRYRLTPNGKIYAMSFLQDSNELIVGVVEESNKGRRHTIKHFDVSGKIKSEFIDTTLTQEIVNKLHQINTSSVRNAISTLDDNFPQLRIKKDLPAPQIKKGISHVELVQSITVSPTNNMVASIDKYNILKTWDRKGRIHNSLKITNNRQSTKIYFQTDSTIFIEPNILLNINNDSTQVINGFEKYSGILFNNSIYFYFNYNNQSRPEKLFDLETSNLKEFDLTDYYTLSSAPSNDRLALLGVDGLIRVINKQGILLSTFGKDRNELITFRDGEKIQLFSKIRKLGISPNGQYIISGDEYGKVIIWKYQ